MPDISTIFKNSSGDLNSSQIQFLLDNLGEDGLNSFLNGGSVPSFSTGGNMVTVISPLTGQEIEMDEEDAKLQALTPINRPTPINGLDPIKPNTTRFAERNYNYLDSKGKRYQIKAGDAISNEAQNYLDSSNFENLQDKFEQDKIDKDTESQNKLMGMLNVLSGDTDFSVEDALYKVGESFAYNPSKDNFQNADGEYNKGLHQTAQGFNALKGIAAGGKAILGATRNVMEGIGFQKKNDMIKNEYQRRQQKALRNQNLVNKEIGGEIPFFNDGSYLQYFEEGTPGEPVSPFTQDEDLYVPGRPGGYAMGNRDYLIDETNDNGPYSNSEEMGPSMEGGLPREEIINGVVYLIYGSGANARMVPKSAVQNNSKSPYNDNTWREPDYSSEYQQKIKDQAEIRRQAEPINIKTLPKNEIQRIQQVLIDSGYDLGKGGADGISGNMTHRALERMKSEDPETFKYWINVNSEAPISNRLPEKRQPLKPTPRHKIVKRQPPKYEEQKNIPLKKEYEKIDPSQFRIKFPEKVNKTLTPAEKRAFEARGGFGGGGRFSGGGASTSGKGDPRIKNIKDPRYRWEEGGEIPFFNDGGYLQFFEEGNGQQYSEMGPQEERNQMPTPREMTGEYIQQQPQQAGIIPNSEIEHKEFVKHPDGQIQQVEGRSHKDGGERLNLEGGTQVISDKLKLGARNAKLINNEHDLNLKAGDTYAKALEKFTKKIGLKELNDQQEEYFNKLKKDGKTKSEDTSELNSQYLSEKINGIEQKKSLLEDIRLGFTDKVYQLQQNSKFPRSSREEGPMEDEESPISEEQIMQALQMAEQAPQMKYGGELQSFEVGGEVIAKIMTSMGLDPVNNPEHKAMYDEYIRQDKLAVLDGPKMYSRLYEFSPSKKDLPKNYEEFKKSPLLRNTFKGQDLFAMVDRDYGTQEESSNPGTPTNPKSKSAANTSKTLEDAPTSLGRRGSEGTNWKSLRDNPLISTDKNAQAFTESGEAIPTSGKVTKENIGSVNKYLFNNFPGARKFFTTEKDRFGRDTDIKLKDVKGYQKYFDQTLLPALKKWGDDNIETKAERNQYFDALDQFRFDDKDKGTRKVDGIFGDYSADKNPIRWKFVTPEEKKKLNDLGVSQVSDLYDEKGAIKSDYSFLSQDSKDRLNKTRNYDGIDMYIDEIQPPVDNSQTPSEGFKKPLGKTYSRPVLPDMSLEPPKPMQMHLKAQHRYETIDPVKLSPEDQLTEIYRQNDNAVEQMTGLTDTQRVAALSNLTANTQEVASKAISGVNAANAQNQFLVDQYNNGVTNKEEDARVTDAQNYEMMQYKAMAATDQDYNDFMDKNREVRIKRFNYLTKDKEINSMVENYKKDEYGNIVFDPKTGLPLSLGSAVTPKDDTIVKTVKNADGTITTTTTTGLTKTTKRGK